MGYWGWRPLLVCVFISVWVTGCNIVTDAAPGMSPTPSPRVTLTVRRLASPTPTRTPVQLVVRATTPAPAESAQASPTPVVYVVQPGDTLGDIALRFGLSVDALLDANAGVEPRALQPGQALIIPLVTEATPEVTAARLALSLNPPDCYETPAGTVLCLGTVDNTLDEPIEQVIVRVQLLGTDGTTLASERVEVEQLLIPAGVSAPYRAQFDATARAYAGAIAILEDAVFALAADERYVALEVLDDEGQLQNGRYVITATLHNPGAFDAQAIRVFATLRDHLGSIIGYRVTGAGERLPAGESLPVRVEIVPQVAEADAVYSLYAEARRSAD